MIVKILSSASNFEGIDYSERKNDLGKSQLIIAENFGALGHSVDEQSKVDYINYMRLICDSNLRVKNRQFHAVISAKDKSHSPQELSKIAEQYLKAMGYGDNPYLIYFHGDTKNNHVHMVSTRVDKKGNKIDDTYEKIRSQKVMQEILNQDPHLEAKAALDLAITFNFSTKAQFKLLLEDQGYKITEKDGQLNLIKYGIVQTTIDGAILKKRIEKYLDPVDRIRQLKAIFHKYKAGLQLDKFMEIMNKKFGLKLILHQHAEHTAPYGYTIIDYTKKEVLKGSQIMPLKELLMPVNEQEKKQLLDGLLNKIVYSTSSMYKVKKELSGYGFELNNEGIIKRENDHNSLGTIDPMNLQLLKYNGRLELARKFTIESEAEKTVLAKLFHINTEDLSLCQNCNKKALNYYTNMLQNLDQKYGANELLQSKKIEVLQFQNSYFLLDRKNNQLIDINKLIPDHTLDFKHLEIHHLDQSAIQESNHHQHTSNPISQLAQLLDLSINESNDLGSRKKKKRKQRRI